MQTRTIIFLRGAGFPGSDDEAKAEDGEPSEA